MASPSPPLSPPAPRAAARRIALVLLLAVAVRAAVLAYTVARDPTFGEWLPAQDMSRFDQWARAMARGDFAFDPRPDRPYAPSYPALVALIYAVAGPRMWAVAAAQAAAGVLTTYAVYRLGARLFAERIALLAALGFAVYVPALFYETRLLRAAWVVLAVALGAWWLCEGLREGRRGWLLAAGLALGWAAALRLTNVLLLAAALGAVWRLGPRGARGRALAALAIGGALAWGPWLTWDAVRPRDRAPTQSSAKINLLAGNTPDATGVFYYVPPTADAILRESGWRTGPLLGGLARSIAERPVQWLGVELRKALVFWHGYEPGNNVSLQVGERYVPLLRSPVLRFWPTSVLALAGLAGAARRTPQTKAVGLLALATYASIAPFLMLSRYRLAIVPLLLPFAAWAALEGLGALRALAPGRRAAAAAALALGLAVTYPRTFRAWFPPGFVPYFETLGRFNLALVLDRTDRDAEALAEYRAVRERDPLFAPAALQEVRLLRALGRDAEARRACAEAAAAGVTAPALLEECRALAGGAG